jgi:hypothetical protein
MQLGIVGVRGRTNPLRLLCQYVLRYVPTLYPKVHRGEGCVCNEHVYLGWRALNDGWDSGSWKRAADTKFENLGAGRARSLMINIMSVWSRISVLLSK